VALSLADTKSDQKDKKIQISKWAIFLHQESVPEDLDKANPLIFSYETHPPLQSYIDRNKTLLAEMNLLNIAPGELGYEKVHDEKMLFSHKEGNSKGGLVDIRNVLWKQYVIESKLQSLLLRRFQGVYVDCLHEARELEMRDPKHFAGLSSAVIEVLQAIRYQYPTVILAVDYDEELTPKLLPIVQYVIADSIMTSTQNETEATLKLTSDSERAMQTLSQWKQRYPSLTILIKEQWNLDDSQGHTLIENKIRQHGFIPFIKTLGSSRGVMGGK
jgi:hypothetical protein